MFQSSVDNQEFVYGYAADGFRWPLWLLVSAESGVLPVHKRRGSKIFFSSLAGIHFFDSWRLHPQLGQPQDLEPLISRVSTATVAGDNEDAQSDDKADGISWYAFHCQW